MLEHVVVDEPAVQVTPVVVIAVAVIAVAVIAVAIIVVVLPIKALYNVTFSRHWTSQFTRWDRGPTGVGCFFSLQMRGRACPEGEGGVAS